MMKLLKIEFAKVKNYKTFWIILGIYAVLVPLWFFGLSKFILALFLGGFGLGMESVCSFPNVFEAVTWTTGWLNILLGILVVILTCNEITFKTERQNIIDGLSRSQLIKGKFLFLSVLALAAAIYTALIGIVFGIYHSGFDNFGSGFQYVGIYLLQTLGYFSIAYLLAVLIRKPALVIIVFLVIFMMNPFLNDMIGNEMKQFVPTKLISDLTPFPFTRGWNQMILEKQPGYNIPWEMKESVRISIGVVYIAAFFIIGFFSVKRRDL